jgi:hypothetical protein
MDRIDALVNWRRISNAVGYGSMSSPAEPAETEPKPEARVSGTR